MWYISPPSNRSRDRLTNAFRYQVVKGADGWAYEGQFSNGLRSGHGTCDYTAPEMRYVGTWCNDEKESLSWIGIRVNDGIRVGTSIIL